MGTNTQIKECKPEEFHLEVLPHETQQAFDVYTKFEFLRSSGWYLAGGTALALQVGHRRSVDLDFFTEERTFDVEALERLLIELGDWTTTHAEKGTLYGLLLGAKTSFIAYPFFRPSGSYVQCGTIRILSPDDIAAMKIIAVSQRGKKRDFIDLYWYAAVHGASIEGAIRRAIAQYPEQEHSVAHFLKSLAYFNDAEDDPMPELFFKANWEEVKAYFRRELPPIAETLLELK